MKQKLKALGPKFAVLGTVSAVILSSSAHAAVDAAEIVTAITSAETSIDSVMAKAMTVAILFMGYKLIKRALARV